MKVSARFKERIEEKKLVEKENETDDGKRIDKVKGRKKEGEEEKKKISEK